MLYIMLAFNELQDLPILELQSCPSGLALKGILGQFLRL